MSLFCKHEWEILSETTTKSQMEHARELGLMITEGYSFQLSRKLIQIAACKKCGKLKRFVEEV